MVFWVANSQGFEYQPMSSPSATDHKQKAASKGPVSVAVVTVSDTRTPETDVNGQYLRGELEAAGHVVHSTRIVRDEPAEVAAALDELAAADLQIVLFNGGTGISQRDRTFDVLSGKLEKTLPGFGEIFRMLSYEQVGAAAMLSRATAGVYRGKIVISTPGSPAAVRLAWEKLIGPEIQHLAWELAR
jgi:molybdenum cofactor biosynthesis protein B